jgi:N-acetylglucosaminyldiphosphoundecaprenol N-acetyl-beta-D-mannosaminyltransferase
VVVEFMYLREGNIAWPSGAEGSAANGGPAKGEPGNAPPAATSAVRPKAPQRKQLPSVKLHGISLHCISEQHCIEHILGELAAGRGGVVITPNVDHLRRCASDLSFSALVAEADLVVADGMPLVWASRLQGTPLPQRVAGSDLISSLSAAAAGQGRSIFLLGGAEGTADAAAAVLRDRFPQLKIAGTFCPPVGFDKSSEHLHNIMANVKAAAPDIVFVALGSPKQERLIDRIRNTLPGAWWLGVGVSFSFLTGDVRRAPLWMRKWGLEWVHRLGQEPKRLFKRYLVVGMPFAMLMLGRALAYGIPNRLLRAILPRKMQLAADDAMYSPPARTIVSDSSDGNGDAAQIAETPLNKSPTIETPDFGAQRRPVALVAQRLRGLVLLGGSVRISPLAAAVGRSVLDLPIGNGQTVLTHWLDQAERAAEHLGIPRLPVRLLVDRNALDPKSASPDRCRVERDTSEYRGTGGLLANVALDYDDDDLILVGNAAQLLLDPLAAMLMALRKTGGMVSVVGHRDGTPSGLMLVTCRALRLIPKAGFVDMKEQGLTTIAGQYDVRVLNCRRPTGVPIRVLSDYVTALRAFHGLGGRTTAPDPMAEDWKSTFVIVEPGASVAPSARLHDSVVLAGAFIEGGAVVVRSVVAGGGIVRRDHKVVDQYVALAKND